MRTALYLTCFFLAFSQLNAQPGYKVIKVKGTIILLKNNEALIKGSEFSENDKLDFRTNDAYAHVIKKGEGRYILKETSAELQYAKANLSPAMPTIPTRGLLFKLNSVAELKNHFKDLFFIPDSLIIVLSKKNLFLENNDYYFIKYQYNGKEISKRLESTKKAFRILRSDIFDGIADNESINTELYYFDYLEKEEKLISKFTAILPEMKTVKEEIKMIVEEMNGAEITPVFDCTYEFLNDAYGKIDPMNAKRLFIQADKE